MLNLIHFRSETSFFPQKKEAALKSEVLNRILNILAELQIQGKHITLCKVLAYIGNKSDEAADIRAKESTDLP